MSAPELTEADIEALSPQLFAATYPGLSWHIQSEAVQRRYARRVREQLTNPLLLAVREYTWTKAWDTIFRGHPTRTPDEDNHPFVEAVLEQVGQFASAYPVAATDWRDHDKAILTLGDGTVVQVQAIVLKAAS